MDLPDLRGESLVPVSAIEAPLICPSSAIRSAIHGDQRFDELAA